MNKHIEMSNKFCQLYYDKTGEYFVPLLFNWQRHSVKNLMIGYPQYFDDWFYSEHIDIKPYSQMLCEKFPQHFKKWWNPSQFDWETCSKYLVLNCIDNIGCWLYHDEFDWKNINDIPHDNEKILEAKHQYVLHQIMK